jgi:hypothetical protein
VDFSQLPLNCKVFFALVRISLSSTLRTADSQIITAFQGQRCVSVSAAKTGTTLGADTSASGDQLFTVIVPSIIYLCPTVSCPHMYSMLRQTMRWIGWSLISILTRLVIDESTKQYKRCRSCKHKSSEIPSFGSTSWDSIPLFISVFAYLPLSCTQCRLALVENLISNSQFDDACGRITRALR